MPRETDYRVLCETEAERVAHPVVEQACLACRKPFASEGPHNRLCKDCRKRDDNPYAL
jgi:hypothetical protein